MSTVSDWISKVEKFSPKNIEELEKFRLEFLSKKGVLSGLFAAMKSIEPANRKAYGQEVNELKKLIESKYAKWKLGFEDASDTNNQDTDISLPGESMPMGSYHPVSIIRDQIIEIFSCIGYNVSEGPEVEDDWHNFTALNFPPEHPARDMQDTFFVEKDPDIALRTHTSSVQVRVMESSKPPIRTISPGRVYRNEAISARAHCFFHQVEGLLIDTNVSFADLKQTLLYFSKEMFGSNTKIRLRPSYFPFTEPSAELDISCTICEGKGCNVCKYTGWVEIMGCGMVDPRVLENCNINSEKYTGFAFGMGIERIAMLKYRVNDLRHFSENDIRLLKQFTSIS